LREGEGALHALGQVLYGHGTRMVVRRVRERTKRSPSERARSERLRLDHETKKVTK
jgi:hypothetical protein